MNEISAGAVVFRKEGDEIKFLLLKYTNYWGFAKGNIEENEDEKTTVKREIEEETGIKEIKFIPEFKETESYTYKREGEQVFKKVIIYLVETSEKKVKISFEHESYRWCNLNEALKLLKYEHHKDLFKKAYEKLTGGLRKFINK